MSSISATNFASLASGYLFRVGGCSRKTVHAKQQKSVLTQKSVFDLNDKQQRSSPQASPVESCRIQLDDAFAVSTSKIKRKVPMKSFFLICAAFALCICSGSWQLRSQTTADVNATVQFSNGQSVTVTDFSEPVGVAPNAIVQVTVAFPEAVAGEHVNIGSLDGGRVLSCNSAITDQGTLSLVFQATPNVGQNRVELRHGAQKLCLQFWVLDTINPQNNPPVITPSRPQG